MDPRAIAKAEGRLRVAISALSDLPHCSIYADFSDKWYVFLTAAKAIYTTLEQGAKTTPQSKQWFGGKATERRNDDLLQYIYQARNDDEHGLGDVTKQVPGSLTITGKSSAGMSIGGNIMTGIVVTNPGELKIQVESAYAVLAPVVSRDGTVLNPPTTHFGVPMENLLPEGVGQLVVAYLEGLIAEAKAL